MDDQEPTPSDRLTPWAPPPEAQGGARPGASPDPASTFFSGTAVDDLGLGGAIASAFRVLGKPAFFLPLLLLSIVVTLTLEAALEPLLRDRLPLTSSAIQARLPVLISSYVVALIGGLLAATYGQVWLVLATRQGEPSVRQAVGSTLDRWLAVLASGLLTGLLLGIVLVPIVFVVRDLVVLIALAPIMIYLVSRLSFATWLAADGRGPIESVRESWSMSKGQVLRVAGWSFGFGILVSILSGVVGLVVDPLPFGAVILQGVTTAMQFGFGIALYRKVEADAREQRRDPRGYL